VPTATLNRKGQITIPLAVRTALGLHAGTKLNFVLEGDGFKVVPRATLRPLSKAGLRDGWRRPSALRPWTKPSPRRPHRAIARPQNHETNSSL
jgi:AbrB family looped-hinge helix DNA binding protein